MSHNFKKIGPSELLILKMFDFTKLCLEFQTICPRIWGSEVEFNMTLESQIFKFKFYKIGRFIPKKPVLHGSGIIGNDKAHVNWITF